MTIQAINIGTVPNDGTGDSARTSFDKINQNFTDPANAAAALVQTSPTDATAGRLLNNETTHIGGEINYTGANYQPETGLGFGVPRLMRNVSGGDIASGGEVAGTQLRFVEFGSSGTIKEITGTPSGTWKLWDISSLADDETSWFLRTA